MDSSVNTLGTKLFVAAMFGREGYTPSDDGAFTVNYAFTGTSAVPTLVVRIGDDGIYVDAAGVTTEVTSVFCNGGTLAFRSTGHEASSEFFALDLQDHTVSYRGWTEKTPEGDNDAYRANQVNALRKEIDDLTATSADDEVVYT